MAGAPRAPARLRAMSPASPSEQRDRAAELVARLRAAWPRSLDAGGVDVGQALEQQLYFALRDRPHRSGGPLRGIRRTLRGLAPLAAAGLALRPRHEATGAGILVLIRQPVHARLLAPVRAAVRSRGGPEVAVARVGAAASDDDLSGNGRRIDSFLGRRSIRDLLRNRVPARALAGEWTPVTGDGELSRALASSATADLGRLRVGAVALREATRDTGAGVLVTYDEVGSWGRLVAAVAAAERRRSVDLPHAEAVDEVAMRGMGFDRIAVFGEVSEQRVLSAGVAPERIVRIGSPVLDTLVARATASHPAEPRRLVFASQYVAGVMTADVKRRTVEAAVLAAEAAAPCELVVVPHPVERDAILEEVLSASAPAGVRVRRADRGTLHDALIGAWLLVTGSSQSVIEAAAAGIPSLTVNLTGGPDPVPYAAEGMALGADSKDGARAAVASLLDDPAWRAAVAGARSSIERHVGPLDGRASERAADLLVAEAAASVAER